MRSACPGNAKLTDAEKAQTAIDDRLTVAIDTLKAAGVAVDPDVVIRGAGMEHHYDRDGLTTRIATLCEES